MKRLKLLFFLFFYAQSLSAQTLSGRQFLLGDASSSADARLQAMGSGGVALENNASVLAINPALLTCLSAWNATITPSVSRISEKQTHSDAARSVDQTAFNVWGLPDIFISRTLDRASFGIGYFTVRDFNYQFKNEQYSQSQLILLQEVKDSGQIRALSGSAAWQTAFFSDKLSLGASYLSYFGLVDQNYKRFENNILTLGNLTQEWSANQWLLGLYWQNSPICFGMTFALPYRLNQNVRGTFGQSSLNQNRRWDLPLSLGAGLVWQQQKKLPILLKLDWRKTWYSRARFSLDNASWQDAQLSDTVEYRLGVEVPMNSKTALRFGAGLETLPFNSRAQAVELSIGLGRSYFLDRLRVSGAMSYCAQSVPVLGRLFDQAPSSEFPLINQDALQSTRLLWKLTIEYRLGEHKR